jgi:hypothetical protein
MSNASVYFRTDDVSGTFQTCPFDKNPLSIYNDSRGLQWSFCTKCGKTFDPYLSMYGTSTSSTSRGRPIFTHTRNKAGRWYPYVCPSCGKVGWKDGPGDSEICLNCGYVYGGTISKAIVKMANALKHLMARFNYPVNRRKGL